MSAVPISNVVVLTGPDVYRALSRIAHEIVEKNYGSANLVIVGLQRGGVWIAEALATKIAEIEPELVVTLAALDVSMHRDDIDLRPASRVALSDIPCDITDTTVVLVDDVLFTGRTVRAALEGVNSFGRPKCVQLAVLVDRGHRELPIRPDFVGKNLPTKNSDEVLVSVNGVIVTAGEKQ